MWQQQHLSGIVMVKVTAFFYLMCSPGLHLTLVWRCSPLAFAVRTFNWFYPVNIILDTAYDEFARNSGGEKRKTSPDVEIDIQAAQKSHPSHKPTGTKVSTVILKPL